MRISGVAKFTVNIAFEDGSKVYAVIQEAMELIRKNGMPTGDWELNQQEGVESLEFEMKPGGSK
jgi:hypothetical protein